MTTTSDSDSASSDYSTESSDDDGMEPAVVSGAKFQFPQGLCERKDIFEEFFTVDLWNSFCDADKEHLQSFLPNFPEDDDLEKTKTLQRLFDFENFRFSNPLRQFHEHLKAGFFRPDIAHMKKKVLRQERKEAKYRYETYRRKLKQNLLESQKKLLNQMKYLPPGHDPKHEKRKADSENVGLYYRTKKRYFQTLTAIQSKVEEADFSTDENYPEGPCPQMSRKQKRHVNSVRNSLLNSKEKLFSTTMGIKPNGCSISLDKYITSYQNPFYISDESYKNVLNQHRKRKLDNPEDPDIDIEGIKMKDIISRTQLPFIRNLQQRSSHAEPKPIFRKRIKREISEPRKSTETVVFTGKLNSFLAAHSSNSDSDSDSIIDAVTVPNSTRSTSEQISAPLSPTPVVQIKQEFKSEPVEVKEEIIEVVQTIQHPSISIPSVIAEAIHPVNHIITTTYGEITPIKMEDLETIDIMNTPIELDNSEIDIMELSIKPELMQDTHANFFSLVRDVICSTNEHRMNMYTLQERLKAWQENPISPLNDWYSYVDNWINILPSAITFLCGNASEQPDDFVPYMEYKMNLDVYQWIGAGRDSDQLLNNLCTFWLQHRTESKLTKPSDIEIDISDRDSTPPPPRCPTTWTVRKSTPEEIKEYQEQERRRYDNPHKAFTFRCNGYESVVGPLRGIYYPATANAKARGHTMLNADRPNFVTILSLVRDATARLPNGEGTRSDICELLKSSQYISSTAPDNILQSVVSGALDRMHTQWDPCVKYDQKRKIWIYLHRHRTEDDFERIHQHYQGIQKVRKPPRKSPAKPKTPKSEKTVKNAKGQNQKVAASSNAANLLSVNSNIASPVRAAPTQKILPSAEIKQENVIIKQEQIISVDDIKEEVIVDVNGVQEPMEIIQPKIPEPHHEQRSIFKTSPEVIAVTVPQKVANKRRQSNFQGKKTGSVMEKIDDKILVVQTSSSNLITTTQKGTSLLISNNPPRQQQQQLQHSQQEPLPTSTSSKTQTFVCNSDLTEDDIPELMQIQVSSSLGGLKNSKAPMVKIVSPSHAKSVIIPTSNPQILKQIQERPSKPVMTQQQYFQITSQNKQKTISTKGTIEVPDGDQVKGAEKNKIPVSIQQQIVQGLTTQQLQNIKNITLLKPNNPTVSVAGSQSKTESQETTQTVVSLPKMASPTETVTLKTSGNLTPSQTQQIIQSIKQKYMPNANVLTPQQQVLLKQKGCVVQLQKPSGNAKNVANSDIGKTMPNNQVPVMAKVLTNAAGQVISVESLLAHQKAHGSLPQGTTLRVQGSKPGQQNVIHLTSNTKSSPIAHFTVGTQNNLVALTTQPKLVVASQTTTATTTVTPSKPQSSRNTSTGRNQQGKSQNVNQQLVNAKLMASEGQKNLQPKVMVGGPAIKVQNKTGNRTANFNSGLRMLNTANLNLTTLDGKPVLLASKSGIQSLHGQNVIVQTHPNSTPTSSSLVIQGGVSKKGQSNQTQSPTSVLNQSGNIVFSSTAIKNQGPQQVIFSSPAKGNNANTTTCQTGHIVLGNQPLRLQTSNAASGQRVVLASQGQGGQILAQQILLPAGFQGTAINIKSLQGVKVIPIAQNQKGQSRQIIAKVMSPNIIKQTTQPQSVQLQESVTIHSSESE